MEDLELLKSAAKAFGGEQVWTDIDGNFYCGDPERKWNPLTDDGDAFRAAALKGISVIHEHPAYVIAKRLLGGEWMQYDVQHRDDYERATRYAITYCLAQIGEKRP